MRKKSEGSKESKTVELSPEKAKLMNSGKIGHEEIYNLVTGDEISWQALIYDLVKSEQLDPLNIDIAELTKGFLNKVRLFEEANFFVSGKVLLATAILLRMKAERVYDQLQYFDDLLFGKEDEEAAEIERIHLSPDELPIILPKTPLPRMKKVTVEELMKALNRAIEVEERRQRRYDSVIEAEKEIAIVLPTQTINITEKIKEIFGKIRAFFSKNKETMTFTELLSNKTREEKIATFVPLLHLDTREQITLNQTEAFGEIFISTFKKQSEEQ